MLSETLSVNDLFIKTNNYYPPYPSPYQWCRDMTSKYFVAESPWNHLNTRGRRKYDSNT